MSCFNSHMSKVAFIEKNWEHIRAPFTAGIELLPNCNLRSIHCYEESERQKHKKSMTNAEVKRVIDILVEHGLLELFFTGGEVLTRPDFKLIENKIPFELEFIGKRQNYAELSQMRNFSKELGVGSITGVDIRPMNDGNQAPLEVRVTPEQVFDFHMNEPDLRDFWINVALREDEHKTAKKRTAGNLYPCSVCYHYVYITHDGNMQGCVKAVKPRYDLLNGNFEDGWKFLDEQVVSKKASPKFPCWRP